MSNKGDLKGVPAIAVLFNPLPSRMAVWLFEAWSLFLFLVAARSPTALPSWGSEGRAASPVPAPTPLHSRAQRRFFS